MATGLHMYIQLDVKSVVNNIEISQDISPEYSTTRAAAMICSKEPARTDHPNVNTWRFEPLVRHWTTRYEAKHSYFKKLAQHWQFLNHQCSLVGYDTDG